LSNQLFITDTGYAAGHQTRFSVQQILFLRINHHPSSCSLFHIGIVVAIYQLISPPINHNLEDAAGIQRRDLIHFEHASNV